MNDENRLAAASTRRCRPFSGRQHGGPGDAQIMNDARPNQPCRRKPPLQFSLRALLVITAVVSLLFGVLRWLEVPPFASAIVLVILIVSVAAALGLVVVIAAAADDRDQ